MHIKLKRAFLGAAATAAGVCGTLVAGGAAQALPPGTAPNGTVNIPSSQPLTAVLAMSPNPAPANCPGDSASDGYRWHAFISDTGNDPATLTYNSNGPVGTVGFTAPLLSTNGSLVTQQTTAVTTGQITPIPGFDLGSYGGALVPGEYNIGFACTLAGETMAYWSRPITVTATGYTTGATPAAPVLTTSSFDAGTSTATVNFTHAASDPATSGYTATLTPVGSEPAIAPISVAAGATSFQVPGVDLGESYTVSLVATNDVGDSVASNTITITGATTAGAPVVTVANVFEGNDVTVEWTAPSTAPDSYDVEITGAATESFPGVSGLSQVVTGLPIGEYTATVTPNYAPGSGITGTPGSASFSVTANALIYQEITVERPAGFLVLTQRCGVYGPLPEYVGVDAFPGFPETLPAEAAVASTAGVDERPDVDLGPGYTPDPLFDSYPLAGTYPTECGLDMGTASLVTSGGLAGQFYAADGRLNQVTVSDFRDDDAGWTARGDVEDFEGQNGDTFSGDYLGWAPAVTDDSDPVGGSTYDQVVTAGDAVDPGTTNGLTGNATLASADPGAGIGIATLDARMALLIPASADADNYAATLSLTVS